MLLNLIYITGICTYALSLLFYISDCISRNPVAKRIGTGLLAITALFQFAGIGIRAMEGGHFHLPVFTLFDFLFLLTFFITLTSIVLTYIKRSEFVALLVNLIGFTIMLVNRLWFTTSDNALYSWETEHRLLLVHIALASISFAALTLGAVLAAIYMFLHWKLKTKRWNDTVRRLPSLEKLDLYSYKALITGTSILVTSLLMAGLSVAVAGRWSLFLDIKVLSTLVALAMYIIYFVKRRIRKGTGREAAAWALIGYGFIILNFFLNSWSAFHSWSGV
ncbi:cytochrome c biogenesis protein [Paenibacillus sp. JCM 10914]|uniref:cytochrome c biogenesis protein CcsA n=1 Tax=Paenibacillus sp. JCM 10914 TaxID=1236974 RepID=UPI00055C1DF3|nr:cytochrome c biogenesis protein CcsA [Paenibacillus sp. JCM 10914]